LVAIARWSVNKGLALVERLAARVPDRAVRIVRAGLDEGSEERLRTLPNVSLVEPAPVEELVAGASVALVPSQWAEPFGRTAYESLAAGVPVLASRVGGLPEHVPDELLVDPPGDVDAWVGAVRRLEGPAAWDSARAAGLSAAETTLRRGGVEPFEQLLASVVRGSVRAPRRARARSR
jgi:glycosyltransferase involved in cell wall biosynthesis